MRYLFTILLAILFLACHNSKEANIPLDDSLNHGNKNTATNEEIKRKTLRIKTLEDSLKSLIVDFYSSKNKPKTEIKYVVKEVLVEKPNSQNEDNTFKTKEIEQQKQQIDNLTDRIKTMQNEIFKLKGEISDVESTKAELEERERLVSRNELKALNISNLTTEYLYIGIKKSPSHIRVVNFCFLLTDNRNVPSGKKTVNLCVLDKKGDILHETDKEVFTTARGEQQFYSYQGEIDYVLDYNVDKYCIEWQVGNTRLKEGKYKIRFYIDNVFSEEFSIEIPN